MIASKSLKFTRYDTLQDLKPYKIGINRGYVNSKEFDAADYLNKEEANNPMSNIKKLIKGRLDMIVAAGGIFRNEISKLKSEKVENFTFIKPILARNQLYILISRKIPDSKKITKDFNRGLVIIKTNGMYDKILKKHGF